MRSDNSVTEIVCAVYQNYDGNYYIVNETKRNNRPFECFSQFYWCNSLQEWTCGSVRSYYPFKWWAVMKARSLEDRHVERQRKHIEREKLRELRRKHVDKKVWR